MGICDPIYKEYPKAKPLVQALIAAAAAQEATAEEFEVAYRLVHGMLQKRMSGILMSELKRDT